MTDEPPEDWHPVLATTGINADGKTVLLAFKPGWFSIFLRDKDGKAKPHWWYVETPEDLLGDDFIDMRPGQEDKFKEQNADWWKQ